jgi:catechol 2,3-dioxygenase-like lactoylglutathione lyase family enzyme
VKVLSLDHLVLTVSDLAASVAFYERLGMEHVVFGGGRHALAFGQQKLNLHLAGAEVKPNARVATPGSADLCFLVDDLALGGLDVELGPVERQGATGTLRSVYTRDPDGNLVELSVTV